MYHQILRILKAEHTRQVTASYTPFTCSEIEPQSVPKNVFCSFYLIHTICLLSLITTLVFCKLSIITAHISLSSTPHPSLSLVLISHRHYIASYSLCRRQFFCYNASWVGYSFETISQWTSCFGTHQWFYCNKLLIRRVKISIFWTTNCGNNQNRF